MTEAEWLVATDPKEMPTGWNRPSERKLTLFCVASGWTWVAPSTSRNGRPGTKWRNKCWRGSSRSRCWFACFGRTTKSSPGFDRYQCIWLTLRWRPGYRIIRRIDRTPTVSVTSSATRSVLSRSRTNWPCTDTRPRPCSPKMYDSRDFSPTPILADALQDAGCDNDNILNHCRGEGPHVRGCWVVDLVLGKE